MEEGYTKTLNVENDESRINENVILSKRLSYILRYGAIREGLTVYENGYIDINEVLSLSIMKSTDLKNFYQVIQDSTSHTGCKRYELVENNGKQYIRATSGRYFDRVSFYCLSFFNFFKL